MNKRNYPERRILHWNEKIIYGGVEKSLHEWLEQFQIPRTNFNRWTLCGRRAVWVFRRYAQRAGLDCID